MSKCEICDTKLGVYECNHVEGKLCCDNCYAEANTSEDDPLEEFVENSDQPEPLASDDVGEEKEMLLNTSVLPARNAKGEELVQVARDLDELRAIQAVSYLADEGIPACTRGMNTMAVEAGGNSIITGGIRLFVYEGDYHIASLHLKKFDSEMKQDGRAYTFLVKEKSWIGEIILSSLIFPAMYMLYPYELTAFTIFLTLVASKLLGAFGARYWQKYCCSDYSCGTYNQH